MLWLLLSLQLVAWHPAWGTFHRTTVDGKARNYWWAQTPHWARLSTCPGNERARTRMRECPYPDRALPTIFHAASKDKGGRQRSHLPSLFSHCLLVLYKMSLLWTCGKRNLTHQLSTPSLFSTRTMGLRLYLASGHGIRPISSLSM